MPGHCTQRTQSLLLTSPNINAADKHKRINGQRDRQTDMHAVGDAEVVIANVKNDVNSSTGRGRIEIDTIVDVTDDEIRRRSRAVCMFKASNYRRARERHSGGRKPVNKYACGCRTRAVRLNSATKKLPMTDGGSHLNMTVST